jgi:glutamine cyclotransferase
MSDGSEVLTVRSPGDFSVLRSIEVTREGGGADRLNELEWDGERLWANRWQTDEILRIDLDCGVVDGVVDASPLTARAEEVMASRGLERDTAERDVLNGIALAGGDGDAYLVTGKRWPVLFEVEFSPSG